MLAIALVGVAAVAATAAPSPQPSAAVTPGPCTSALPDLPNDFETAFAYDLQDARLLRFIALLANVPQNQQHALFAIAAAADAAPGEQRLDAVLATYCATLDEQYATTRALSLVSNRWTLRELHDAKRFDGFARAVADAIVCILLRDRLSPEIYAAGIAPFASLLTATPRVQGSAAPQASLSLPCVDHNARTVHIVQPSYPALAAATALSGSVAIKVTLNEAGDVRYARVYTDTLGSGLGAKQVIRESIFAAAATTFAPGTTNCVPTGGTYIFTSDFTIR